MGAKGKKRKFLYEIVLANDEFELPIFVGTLKEVSIFVDTSSPNVRKRGMSGGVIKKKYKVFRVDLISDDEEEELLSDGEEVEDG